MSNPSIPLSASTSIVCGIFVVVLSGFLYSVLAALVKWGDTIGHSCAMMLLYQSIFQISFASLTFILSSHCDRDKIYKCYKFKSHDHPKQMCDGGIQCMANNHSPGEGVLEIHDNTADPKSVYNVEQIMKGSVKMTKKGHGERRSNSESDDDSLFEHDDKPTTKGTISGDKSDTIASKKSDTISLQQVESISSLRVDEIYPTPSPTPWISILSHGIFATMASYLYFTAVHLIPIGSAVTLTSLSCLSSSLFGCVLLKDLVTRYHIVAFILGLNGALLTSQPSAVFRNADHGQVDYDDDIYWTGSVIAILCAVVLGLAHLSLRFAKEISWILLMISHGIFSLLLALALLLPFDLKWTQSTEDIICIISIGFVGFAAQSAMLKGTKMLIEGVSSLLQSSINVICSFMFQIILFEMYPDRVTVIGAMVTLAAIVIITMERARAANQPDKRRADISLQSISYDLNHV